MCDVLLPPGVNPTAKNIYIISYVPGFSGKDTDTVKHDLMAVDNAVFSHT
jgi:hypothetical protein